MDSIDSAHAVLLVGAFLVLVGIASSLVAQRFGAPLLFVFLLIGMLAGQDGPGGLVFNDYQATYLVGSVALAIILFDGGLRTRLSRFRGALMPACLLSTVGVIITASVVAVFVAWIFGFSWLEAALLGAIVASTDAAAVFFLLRSGGLRLRPKVGDVLEIESGTNDPIAVFLTVLLTGLILAGAVQPDLSLLINLANHALIGAVLGVAAGFIVTWLLNRIDFPTGLHPLFVSAAVLVIFALIALLGGSGLLGVYLMGLVIGNRSVRALPAVVSFHNAITWLSQIVMFLVLGLLVVPSKLIEYIVPGLVIALLLIFVARPVAVWACLVLFGFRPRELLFISWVGLRGAVSIFLAAIPMLSGVPHAEAYFNAAFFVVLISLLLQGWTIRPLALRLGLAMPDDRPQVSRMELDLPGQLEQELVAYPIDSDSPVLDSDHLPGWVRLAFVVRDGAIIAPEQTGTLRPRDYAYFLVPPARVRRLDRLIAPRHPHERPFGELTVNGEAGIGEIAELYDLGVPDEIRGMSVGEFIAKQLDDEPQLGDAIIVGDGTLVVREVADARITKAGLQLPELTAEGLPTEQVRAFVTKSWSRLRRSKALPVRFDSIARRRPSLWWRKRRSPNRQEPS